MAVALYESTERIHGATESLTELSPGLAVLIYADPPHTVQTTDTVQTSGLPTWAIVGIKPGLADCKAEA
ncbi:hypothetical protein Ddc_12032 [Ditylenchus destructor]|nr:hypothetical protein Ddc_12032 [Ditylenchus destructor]